MRLVTLRRESPTICITHNYNAAWPDNETGLQGLDVKARLLSRVKAVATLTLRQYGVAHHFVQATLDIAGHGPNNTVSRHKTNRTLHRGDGELT